jgi:hypothetical protein
MQGNSKGVECDIHGCEYTREPSVVSVVPVRRRGGVTGTAASSAVLTRSGSEVRA